MHEPLLSILICTHNRSQTLARTLNSLRSLKTVKDVDIELIVVANGCTDDTVDVVQQIAKLLTIPLHLHVEKQASLNLARNLCLEKSRGDLLAFLDDDVLVDPDWIEAVLHAYQNTPADLLAGRIALHWECREIPHWNSPIVERLLSKLDHGNQIKELRSAGKVVGANFSFKRKVLNVTGLFQVGLDRAGQGLLSGGDTDFVSRALSSGFRLFYIPDMSVKHIIPTDRSSKSYLLKLSRGRGRTRVILSTKQGMFSFPRWMKSGLTHVFKSGWGQLADLFLHKNREAFDHELLRARGYGILSEAIHQACHSMLHKRDILKEEAFIHR